MHFDREPIRLTCDKKRSFWADLCTNHTQSKQGTGQQVMTWEWEGTDREWDMRNTYWGGDGVRKAGVRADMKEWTTQWMMIIIRWERVSKYEDCCCVLLGPLDESVLHLADWSRKSSALTPFRPLFIPLSCLALCHSFSPSYLPQVLRYLPPGCCCLVLRGARCTFVLLSGPVWAQRGARRRTRTVLLSRRIPLNEGYGGRVLCRGAKMGGDQSEWGSGVCVCDCRDCLTSPPPPPPPPPAYSRPILSCPSCAAGQANAPAWNPHPRARRLSPPSPRFYRNIACATHTGVPLRSFRKEAQWDIELHHTPQPRNQIIQTGLMYISCLNPK